MAALYASVGVKSTEYPVVLKLLMSMTVSPKEKKNIYIYEKYRKRRYQKIPRKRYQKMKKEESGEDKKI